MKQNEGLLFYLSGETGTVPDVANGNPVPNFLRSVETISDGVGGGKALRCLPDQLLAFWAPGNIYSQCGTVSFFWRPRTALGETEFPLFRVSFADHSSWDSLFMRIDWNGHGIDAFVTDINLSRLRVSQRFETIPEKDQWFHLAFAWDEKIGVRLYLNGVLAAQKDGQALLYAGLDQFGTHSRIISNAQVQSSYNYMRTGDFDELMIFDRMLNNEQIKGLSALEIPVLPALHRTLEDETMNAQWQRRFGFDGPAVPFLSHPATVAKKVEIHDAWDLKRWWWKACDGIRETTWPGVYNRSGLTGRLDYFVLPDWDCYSISGKEITFEPLADTYWNHMELSGAAEGNLRIHGRLEETLTTRRESCERSVLRLAEPARNVSITFTNDVIEQPIGDITLLHVHPGCIPDEATLESFSFSTDSGQDSTAIDEIRQFIKGRFMADEQALLIGQKNGTPINAAAGLPLYHFAMPYTQENTWGMDGLLLDLPALSFKGEESALVTVQVKDPLWIYRDMIHFTFALKTGMPKKLFLDTRDRILPQGHALYMTIAFSTPPDSLSGLNAAIVYKPYECAKMEHIADRFIQVKDNYANLVEENPSNEHFNMYNRFKADLEDLLRVAPDHRLALEYYYDKFKVNPPAISFAPCPEGIPLWAWRQTEYMGYIKRFLRWWIDKRQIENGEFGGGLSDDGDLTAWWPGPAMAGIMPEKIKASLLTEMEAFYDQGMFSNGLCAIQTDQLHTLEEGIQALGQCLTLDPASPKQLERAMENARGLNFITGITEAGHRHVLSGYYSGTRLSTEKAWAYSASDSFHVFHPAYMLVRYNGNLKARKLILETADGMLSHFDGSRLHVQIDLETDTDSIHERTREWPLFYAAWRFTGEEKYLKAIYDQSLLSLPQDRLAETKAAQEQHLVEKYEKLIRQAALREYINTDAQLWVDRCVIDIAAIQEDRIGGVGHERFSLFPRHFLRWQFAPGQETDVAILVTHASPERLALRAFNMTDSPITAQMGLEDVLPGEWRIEQDGQVQLLPLERFAGTKITFPPIAETNLELSLQALGVPYWQRCDLGIEKEDVLIRPDCLRIRVHNLGAAQSEPTTLVLRDKQGHILRSSNVPPLPPPNDLYPKTVEIPLWTRGLSLDGAWIELDPEHRLNEITRLNNIVHL